jgi:serine-type D-Ala-D-Ala carboxypeptidase (penicillin-binding protein 5/6)
MQSLSRRLRVAHWCAAALAIAVIDSGTPASAASRPSWPSAGQSALAVDGLGSLGTSGPVTRPQPIASVAKVMDAYQVLSDHPLRPNDQGPTITVLPSEAGAYWAERFSGQTLAPVTAGERISERQALETMLLPSANDMARILARWDAGSIAAFLDRENRTAARLGMTHTHYTDPAGVDFRTVSTAPDQLRLAQAAMAVPALVGIVRETSATVPVAGTVHNMNHLLGHYGVIGVKTGWTSAAGGCLMFVARVNGKSGTDRTVYGVVLGQHGGSSGGNVAAAAAATKLVNAARAAIRAH